mmetsp:Transcript_54535/g.129529  ORF Transcript_54535/g.129529 Transcript_54535/m.129529 type:complete len:212 (-) Transcript_54535:1722-2357(-)
MRSVSSPSPSRHSTRRWKCWRQTRGDSTSSSSARPSPPTKGKRRARTPLSSPEWTCTIRWLCFRARCRCSRSSRPSCCARSTTYRTRQLIARCRDAPSSPARCGSARCTTRLSRARFGSATRSRATATLPPTCFRQRPRSPSRTCGCSSPSRICARGSCCAPCWHASSTCACWSPPGATPSRSLRWRTGAGTTTSWCSTPSCSTTSLPRRL